MLRFAPDDTSRLTDIVRQRVAYRWYSDDPDRELVLQTELERGAGPTIDAAIEEMRIDYKTRAASHEFSEWAVPQSTNDAIAEVGRIIDEAS